MYVFLSIVAPPETWRATELSARDVASSVLLITKLPETSALALRSNALLSSVLPYTLRPSPIARFLPIAAPPVNLIAPSAAYDPVSVCWVFAVNVLTPDVWKVSLIWVASPTVNVPIIFVLPLSVSIENLVTAEPFWMYTFSFAALTTSESIIFVWPCTVNVPCVSVLPLSVSTVNLSTLLLFCILNVLLSALIVTLSCNVVAPSTLSVVLNSTCPSAVNVPAVFVSPVALSIKN